MERRTVLVNPKGGTGKTTSTVNLAALAAMAGYRTLVVDLDEQGSSTQWLGGSPNNNDLAPALVNGHQLDDLVLPTSIPRLELVPGSVSLVDDSQLTKEPGHQYLLREALNRMTRRDWIFIDCPGDLGPLTIMGMTAATDVLIPITAGGQELDEIPKIKAAYEKVQARLNADLVIAGVLVTRVDSYGGQVSIIARSVMEQLRKEFPDGELLPLYVQEYVRHREAPAWRQPTVTFDPDGRGAKDYKAVLAELIRRGPGPVIDLTDSQAEERIHG